MDNVLLLYCVSGLYAVFGFALMLNGVHREDARRALVGGSLLVCGVTTIFYLRSTLGWSVTILS